MIPSINVLIYHFALSKGTVYQYWLFHKNRWQLLTGVVIFLNFGTEASCYSFKRYSLMQFKDWYWKHVDTPWQIYRRPFFLPPFQDFSRGQTHGAIRFSEPNDNIKALAEKMNNGEVEIAGGKLESAAVLEGEEETKYWQTFIEFVREKSQHKFLYLEAPYRLSQVLWRQHLW